MKNQYLLIIITLLTGLLLTACNLENKNHLKIWYDQPADATAEDNPNGWRDDAHWLRALPLGNGSMGAMVFGDINKERIQLSEESMWSGSPNDDDNPEAPMHLENIRHLLFTGKYKEATDLINQTQICQGAGTGHGNGANVPFGCFQTLGDLWIDFDSDEPYTNYHRELDLDEAIVNVSYTQDEVDYTRSYFVSQPDQVLVVRLQASKPGSLSFNCSLTRPERFTTESTEDQLIMNGALKDGKGGDGLQYMARLKAVAKNGSVSYSDARIVVEEADEVLLFLTASTDYVLDYPNYTGRAYTKLTADRLDHVLTKSYKDLLKDHLTEYQPYYSRVRLDLHPVGEDTLPTDQRLDLFKEHQHDPHLVELMFQFGRYVLISSSRPGSLPANLQGVWANKIQTPWNSDYHTDVNVQMNYWPAEITNLPEMHLPLFDLLEEMVKPGKKTAQIQYNMDGWVVHPVSNVWGYTSPGERAKWGLHSGGGAWISTHIADHFAFTKDLAFLERMYPVLEESVKFYLDWLVEHPETGQLVSGPAVSPENSFRAPDGSPSQFSMGPAHDQQVIWQLFSDYLMASSELDKNGDLVEQVKRAKEQLAGPQISSDGRLMEWAEEFPELEPGHRHISHLFALHPGAQINSETPELMEAARKSLDHRIANGGGHTGWSAAWLISQYARLGDGEKALQSLHTVLTKSTSPNLFGQHPPFQMDGNFGTTAGIAEMLLQSQNGVIQLLPAVPFDKWPNGEVKGLKARGNFEVDITWENGEMTKAKIKSNSGGTLKLQTANGVEEYELEKGEELEI